MTRKLSGVFIAFFFRCAASASRHRKINMGMSMEQDTNGDMGNQQTEGGDSAEYRTGSKISRAKPKQQKHETSLPNSASYSSVRCLGGAIALQAKTMQ
jgi:hypothetical protein